MAERKNILVVVDPTAAFHTCIERAAWFAQHISARLELFISDYAPQLAEQRTDHAATSTLIDRHHQRLERLAEPLRTRGLSVRIDARLGHPLHDSIVRKAQESSADFVVKDTHYHSVLKRSIFSNTDWSLIRNCAAPLWLVKPRPLGQSPCFVAAVDPLHARDKPATLDRQILQTAKHLAQVADGTMHVFHAYDVSPAIAVSTDAMTMPIALPMNGLADAMAAEHSEAVGRLCAEYGVPSERMHVQRGGTRQTLLELTDRLRADAVVIGALSRSGLKGLFLGNTAESVLDQLHCDLIILKPAGFQAAFSS